jgi:hypothetical protein
MWLFIVTFSVLQTEQESVDGRAAQVRHTVVHLRENAHRVCAAEA